MPEKSHGHGSLAGYSPGGHKELDATEHAHTMPRAYMLHFFLTSGFPGGSAEKNLLVVQETWVQSLGQADSLEKEMTTHSSILARKIPWTEEPGRLQLMGS